MNPAVEKYYESLSGVTPRVKHGIEAIEMEISRKEEELRQLRSTLTEAQKILYVLDPEAKPKPKQRRSRAATNGNTPAVSEDKMAALKEWLDRTYAGVDTFSGPEILAREDFDLMSEPTLRSALAHMHEAGQITLDSVGPTRRKNYRLVRA